MEEAERSSEFAASIAGRQFEPEESAFASSAPSHPVMEFHHASQQPYWLVVHPGLCGCSRSASGPTTSGASGGAMLSGLCARQHFGVRHTNT